LQKFGPAAAISGNSDLLPSVQATPSFFRSLFSMFQDVANPGGVLPSVRHGVEHVIETSDCPVMTRFWQLDVDKLSAAKLKKEGIIQQSSSCWASPLHM
jgi:hypothetical protein